MKFALFRCLPTIVPGALLSLSFALPGNIAAQPARDGGTATVTTRTVGAGETLSSVARAVRPPGVTLDQTLLGLFRANPQAFTGGNMNRLRAGASLAVPTAAELGQTPPDEARAAVRTQHDESKPRRAGPALAASPVAPPAPRPAPAKAPAQPEEKPARVDARAPTVALVKEPSAATPQANPDHHVAIDPPLPRTAGVAPEQIEVVEYFWYGCPHCFDMEPAIHAWATRQQADVAVRRLPAILGMLSEPGARLYFTLEALGQAERLHSAVFAAAHREGRLHVTSSDEERYAEWAARHGIDKAAFLGAWSSPAVAARMKQASEWSKAFRSRKLGVPLFVVEGRWATNASLTDDEKTVLPEVDGLVAKARGERGKK